jgi:serine/threonine protein phosphatase 1
MNYYAVGDIHGQYFKLKALMEKLFIKDDDVVIFLGDYIDRGKMVFEVVDYLIRLKEQINCVFLKGNHELMFMDYLSGIDENLFMYNGGHKTVLSYEEHGWDISRHTYYLDRFMPREHIEFFKKLKPYYETDNYIFVHAGVWPGTPMEKLPDEILYWDRSFIYTADKYVGKTVICGHSPSAQISNYKHAICIDTGACFDSMGHLTAVKLPEREFIRQGTTLEELDGNG